MNTYNILWLDDDCNDKDMIPFLVEAEGEGIILEGYESFEEAFENLENKFPFFDAILLDGMFLEKKDQVAGTEDEVAIGMAIAKINEIKSKKAFPWFVLSGKEQFTKEKNSILKANKARCFDKTNPNDVVELFKEIKKAADELDDTQTRHRYQRVFEVCTEKYIGINASYDLLSILKKENTEKAFSDPVLYFTPLRKIMEDLFSTYNKFGLLPDVFIKPVALNETSKFLSGAIEKGYQLDKPVFTKVVSDYVRSILAVCQPAAHRAEIDEFVAEVNTPYLLLSITYQLLDVLIWSKNYFDKNNNVALNQSRFKTVDAGIDNKVVNGIIEKDDKGNFHCGDIILTYKHINDKEYNIGDSIRIIKSSINTNEKTMHSYQKNAIQTEKV